MPQIRRNTIGPQMRVRLAALKRLLAWGLLTIAVACSSVSDDFVDPQTGLPDPIEAWQYRTVDELEKLLEPGSGPPYAIGQRDELTITVWGYPDLGSQVPLERDSRRNVSIVQENGTVSLPFLGNVKVLGLTVEEIRQKIERLYRQKTPGAQADVVVSSYLSKVVLLEGEFKDNRRLFLTDRLLTLGDAVAAAGGFTEQADPSKGILVRNGTEYHFDYFGTRGGVNIDKVLLQAGDRVHIPSATEQQVFVFGEVFRQGAVRIPPEGLQLVQALANSGGPRVVTADLSDIFLVRHSGSGAKVYRFSLADALSAPTIPLQHNDRLLLNATALAKWDRFWRQALPFFTSTNSAVNAASNVP